MIKKYILLIVVIFSQSLFAQQEVCESSDANEFDVNSITKCTIEPVSKSKGKKDRQIKVRVSASRRYLKKREIVKKQSANSINLKTGSVSSINNNENPIADLNATIAVSKEQVITTSKNSIAALSEKLSKEELKKAVKFHYVDRVPQFKACEGAKKKDQRDCFNMEMIKHINKYFRYPSEAVRNSIEGEVWVRFIIDKDGAVKNIKTLGPENGEILNDEAKRVVLNLPAFKAAKNNGEKVSVKYGFPINFSLQE